MRIPCKARINFKIQTLIALIKCQYQKYKFGWEIKPWMDYTFMYRVSRVRKRPTLKSLPRVKMIVTPNGKVVDSSVVIDKR